MRWIVLSNVWTTGAWTFVTFELVMPGGRFQESFWNSIRLRNETVIYKVVAHVSVRWSQRKKGSLEESWVYLLWSLVVLFVVSVSFFAITTWSLDLSPKVHINDSCHLSTYLFDCIFPACTVVSPLNCWCVNFWCCLSSPFRLKLLSHSLHLNGFSPVWILLCSLKCPLWLKRFKQKLHSKRFSPAWVVLCCLSCPLRLNLVPHCLHSKRFSLVWGISVSPKTSSIEGNHCLSSVFSSWPLCISLIVAYSGVSNLCKEAGNTPMLSWPVQIKKLFYLECLTLGMHNVRASEPYETDMQGIWKYARHLKHARQHQLIKKDFGWLLQIVDSLLTLKEFFPCNMIWRGAP